jgi:hypothetical protein
VAAESVKMQMNAEWGLVKRGRDALVKLVQQCSSAAVGGEPWKAREGGRGEMTELAGRCRLVLAGWCSGAVCSRQPVMRSMIDLVIVTTLRPREPLANQSAPEITTQRACSWCTRAGHNFPSQLPHRHRIGVASCTIIQHCHCHCHVVADPGTTSRRAVCFPAIVTIVSLTDPLRQQLLQSKTRTASESHSAKTELQ